MKKETECLPASVCSNTSLRLLVLNVCTCREISLIGWMVPTSLFECMMVTKAVFSVRLSRTSEALTAPTKGDSEGPRGARERSSEGEGVREK